MTALDIHSLGEGDIRTPHTVEVLPRVVRHATGRNAEGKSVFLSTDDDDHGHRELMNKSTIASINHSTYQHPVELNGNVDTEYTQENEAQPEIPVVENGSACRMVDFAPGGASPMQRVDSLDCVVVVIEGVVRMILDSGEERTMKRGDIAVQQSTAHRWVNVTGNGLLPARILVVPLHNTNDPHAGGGEKKVQVQVQRKLGLPRRHSVWLPPSHSPHHHQTEDGPDRGRFAKFYENDYWESEF
ncbi:MAG: hypothetical protein Q9216_001640 [Gyalolechia sp. 2 TL-2023]